MCIVHTRTKPRRGEYSLGVFCQVLSTRNLRRFPQPVADFGCAADRIQDLGADAVAPGRVAAFRLVVQRAEIAGHSDQLGTIATEPLRYETCGPHLDQTGCDR